MEQLKIASRQTFWLERSGNWNRLPCSRIARARIANFLGNLVTYKIVSQGHLLTLLAYLNFNDLGNFVVGLSFKILVSSAWLKLALQSSPWQSRRRSKSLYFVFSPSGQSQEIGYEIKTEPEKKHTVQLLLSFYHKANWTKIIIKPWAYGKLSKSILSGYKLLTWTDNDCVQKIYGTLCHFFLR